MDDFDKITRLKNLVGVNRENDKLQRARLIAWERNEGQGYFECTIRFIDTGKTQKIRSTQLFKFKMPVEPSKMPPRCFQCCLAEIKPITINISGGSKWDVDANAFMKNTVKNKKIKTEVNQINNLIIRNIIYAKYSSFSDLFRCQRYRSCENLYR